MSDADVKCYEKRYNDLNGKGAREHYMMTGKEQGRLATCAEDLTDYQSQRYIKMNPVMQYALGISYNNTSIVDARQNYTDVGFSLKRDIKVPTWDKIW